MAHQITAIERRTEITDEGTVVPVQVIKFTTHKGQRGEIRVSTAASDEEIRAGVRQEADRLDSLLGPV